MELDVTVFHPTEWPNHMLVLLICEVIPYNEVFHAETQANVSWVNKIVPVTDNTVGAV